MIDPYDLEAGFSAANTMREQALAQGDQHAGDGFRHEMEVLRTQAMIAIAEQLQRLADQNRDAKAR